MAMFLPSEIARLVLGYLEEQQCQSAYETFLETNENLSECLRMKRQGQEFRTTVLGLSLLDILGEYSVIETLVQERLKKVDKETRENLKKSTNLVDKLALLLNVTSTGQTMFVSITLPPGKSPTSNIAHVRKGIRHSSFTDRRRENLRKNMSLRRIEEGPEHAPTATNLETTSLNSLPGNSSLKHPAAGGDVDNSTEEDIVRTPKRKQMHTKRSRSNSNTPNDDVDLTVYSNLLLDYELHEKIAENINKVIHTPEIATNTNAVQETSVASSNQNQPVADTPNNQSNNFTMELDNVIKKIVKDTETDPVFENFLREVIGPDEEASDDTDDRGISTTSTPNKTLEKQPPLRNRLRSAKLKQTASPVSSLDRANSPKEIEDHNAVAIQSIIAINSEDNTDLVAPEQEKNTETTKQSVEQIETPIIPELQPLNKSNPITIDTTASTGTENLVVEPPGKNVLMISQQPQPQYMITDSFQSVYQQQTDNRFILLGNKFSNNYVGQQIVTVPQPYQMSQPTTISNEEIMAMPLIITDSVQPPTFIVPSQIYQPPPNPISIPRPKRPQSKIAPKIIPCRTETAASNPKDTIRYRISVETAPEPSPVVIEPKTTEPEPSCSRALPVISLSSTKKSDSVEGKITTPVGSKNKVHNLSSPRSGRSHIRALDFSTPLKDTQVSNCKSTPKSAKSKSSPRSSSTKKPRVSKTPVKATQSPVMKLRGGWNKIHGTEIITGEDELSSPEKRPTISESEPNTSTETKKTTKKRPTKSKTVPINPKTRKKKSADSWDEDLRALIQPEKDTKRVFKRIRPTKPKQIAKKVTNAQVKGIETTLIELNESKTDENEPKTAKDKIAFIKIDPKTIEPIQIDEDSVRNIVPKPKYKKKCNTGFDPKKTTNPDDKSGENSTQTDEGKKDDTNRSHLTILSPSIVANKQTSGNVELITKHDNNKTPDDPKPDYSCPGPSTANLNITPMLETPLKFDSLLVPITPRLYTPFGDSPFSKIFTEKDGSIDLNLIPTPNLPITPHMAITPNSQGYPTRGTDYSNSSSYYQPSDSEQNIQLEKELINECKRQELSTKHRIVSEQQINAEENNYVLHEVEIPNSEHEFNIKYPEKTNLLNRSSTTVSSSSSNSSDSSYSNTSTDSDCNETIIQKQKTPIKKCKKPKTPVKKLKTPEKKREHIKIKIPKKFLLQKNIGKSIEEYEDVIPDESRAKSKVTKSHLNLLEELAEKRKRVMAGLKQPPPTLTTITRKPRKNARNQITKTKRLIVTRSKSTSRTEHMETEDQNEAIVENVVNKEEVNKLKQKTKHQTEQINKVEKEIEENLNKEKLKEEIIKQQEDPIDPIEEKIDENIIKEKKTQEHLDVQEKNENLKINKHQDDKIDKTIAKTIEKTDKPEINEKSKTKKPLKRKTKSIELIAERLKTPSKDLSAKVKELILPESVDKQINETEQKKKDINLDIVPIKDLKKESSHKNVKTTKIKKEIEKIKKDTEKINKKEDQKTREKLDNTKKEPIKLIIKKSTTVSTSSSKETKAQDSKLTVQNRSETQTSEKVDRTPLESQKTDKTQEPCDSEVKEHKKSESENLVQELKRRGILLQPKIQISDIMRQQPPPKTQMPDIKPDKFTIKTDKILNESEKINLSTIETCAIKPNTILTNTQEEVIVENKIDDDSFILQISDDEEEDADIYDIKTIDEDSIEYIKYAHDPLYKPAIKVASASDLPEPEKDILKRTIEATVLIDDEEKVITFTVTPFVEIYSNIKQRNQSESDGEETKKCKLTTAAAKSKSSSDAEEIGGKKVTISLEQYKMKCNKKKSEIMEASDSTNKIADSQESVAMADEWESNSDVQETCSKKRGLSPDSDSSKQNTEKRIKSNKQALLRALDLDSFLSKVHGPEDK